MAFGTKQVRYAYWLFIAFIKKNAQSILLSFLISLISVIAIVSLSPYLLKVLISKTQVIGITGEYTIDTLPENIISKFSNGLLYINNSGEVIPLLVDSWEPLENGQTYKFHLKKDLVWNDGKTFTAKDIRYNFKDVRVTAEDDYLLTFELPKPLPIFPVFLTHPILKYPLVGVAGVYKVQKVRYSGGFIKELQLTPNKENEPILIYKFYDTDSKLIEAYKLGEISEMTTSRQSVSEQFSNWKNSEVIKNIDYTKVMTLFFNLNDPVFKEDKDMRHAIAESIDKLKISEKGINAYSPIPPVSWAHNPDVKKYPYNQNFASKIFNKYNESSGSASLTISTYYDHLDVADILKEEFEKSGLDSKVEVLTGNLPSNFKILLAQLTLSKDPDQYFFWHSTQQRGLNNTGGTNITSYKNVRIDKLLEDGRNTFNLQKRKDIYTDFQRVLVEDMPAYFLYYPYTYTIKRK